MGNTCFLNAVLQCFMHIVPLIQSIQACDHPSPCDGRINTLKFQVFFGLCVLLLLYQVLDWPISILSVASHVMWLSSYFCG